MRNCLKASVSLPTSGSYVKSGRFLTMDLEPFEFTKVSAWGSRAHVA